MKVTAEGFGEAGRQKAALALRFAQSKKAGSTGSRQIYS